MAALKMLWKRLFVGEAKSNTDREVSEKEDMFTGILAPIESYIVILQSILIWENPLHSTVSFTVCNILFWLIVYCQYRFYFVIASITVLSYVYRTWTKQIWPEIRVPIAEGEDNEEWTPVNPQVFSVPEISRYLNQSLDDFKLWFNWFINLRRDHPGRFCVTVTSCLIILCLIGRCVSGIFISYILMCFILMGPGFFVHIYPHIRLAVTTCDYFSTTENASTKVQGTPDDLVDEFFPESSPEVIDALAKALESSVTTEQEEELNETETDVEVSTKESEEFVLSLNFMPSYDKDSDSETEVEEPIIMASAVPKVPKEPITFVSSHYEDLDSDEADEDRLTEGLVFEDDLDSRLGLGSREISPAPSSTSSDQPERFTEAPVDPPPVQKNPLKPLSRRSSQSDVELSDYEMISESELS